MLESAEDSIPFSVAKIKIEEIVADRGESEDFQNIILKLFDPEYYQDINKKQSITDLPNDPVFEDFKNLLSNGITEINRKYGYNINIGLFLTEFNSNFVLRLGKEKVKNEDLKNLLHKYEINQNFQNLQVYLENAKNLFLEPIKVFGKPLNEYYVENPAYEVEKGTWEQDEKEIDKKVGIILKE